EPHDVLFRLVYHGDLAHDRAHSNDGIRPYIDDGRRGFSVPLQGIEDIRANGRSFPVREGEDRSGDALPFERMPLLNDDPLIRVNTGKEGDGSGADKEPARSPSPRYPTPMDYQNH